MFGRFGSETRAVIALAEDHARALWRPAVGPEHLLLALLVADERGVLERGGLRFDDLRAELLERATGEGSASGADAGGRDLPLHLREVFRGAFRHAAMRGDSEVTPMHLALALVADPPGEVAAALRRLGLDAADLHQAVVTAMTEGDAASARPAARHNVVELPRQPARPSEPHLVEPATR